MPSLSFASRKVNSNKRPMMIFRPSSRTIAIAALIVTLTGCSRQPPSTSITPSTLQAAYFKPDPPTIPSMPQLNRECNHSQRPGDPPLTRRFVKPEVMIPIKCNIHSWMRSYLGVLDHPYLAVTKDDGAFTIPNLPPGTYTLTTWH